MFVFGEETGKKKQNHLPDRQYRLVSRSLGIEIAAHAAVNSRQLAGRDNYYALADWRSHHVPVSPLPLMDFDLTIPIDIGARGWAPSESTFDTWLAPRTLDLVCMTSPAARDMKLARRRVWKPNKDLRNRFLMWLGDRAIRQSRRNCSHFLVFSHYARTVQGCQNSLILVRLAKASGEV